LFEGNFTKTKKPTFTDNAEMGKDEKTISFKNKSSLIVFNENPL